MIVLHGENQVLSRRALQEIKEKALGKEIVELSEKSSLTEVIQALESSSLFGTDKLVVLENLLSGKKNKGQKEICEYFEKNENKNLVLWESKEVSEAALKKLKAEVKNFKVSAEIFKLMDILKENNREQILQTWESCLQREEVELIFHMLVRQIRMLLQAKTPGVLKGHPFVIQKTQQQAKNFDEVKLLELHQRLYEIDKRQKTGATPLPLEHEIEMWLVQI